MEHPPEGVVRQVCLAMKAAHVPEWLRELALGTAHSSLTASVFRCLGRLAHHSEDSPDSVWRIVGRFAWGNLSNASGKLGHPISRTQPSPVKTVPAGLKQFSPGDADSAVDFSSVCPRGHGFMPAGRSRVNIGRYVNFTALSRDLFVCPDLFLSTARPACLCELMARLHAYPVVGRTPANRLQGERHVCGHARRAVEQSRQCSLLTPRMRCRSAAVRQPFCADSLSARDCTFLLTNSRPIQCGFRGKRAHREALQHTKLSLGQIPHSAVGTFRSLRLCSLAHVGARSAFSAVAASEDASGGVA